jgi:thymidylate synthase
MKSIRIVEKTLPIAWEKAVLACWEQGDSFPTQYDKPDDPNSRDVLAVIHVTDPMSEPRIHRAFPGGLNDLEKYRSEVLYGVHDHWVNPAEGKWEYTYHQRLFEYDVPDHKYCCGDPDHYSKYDQIQKCIDMLKKCGHTRRAQAVTWKVWEDLGIHDPACLQRLWFRVQNYQTNYGSIPKLNMTVHMRSNDAYKAAFMNMYAFTELQAWVAAQVGVAVGEYIHIADSFHIYGSYFSEFEGFINTVNTREEADRVFESSFAYDFMLDGCDELLAEKDMPDDKKKCVTARILQLRSLMGG